MTSKIQMTKIGNNGEEHYESADGRLRMAREHDTLTPNGNRMNGRWVLRNAGEFVDFDKYCSDLAERHNLELFSVRKERKKIC